MPSQLIRPLLRPRDAAAVLSVSLSTLKRMTDEGRIPAPVRISKRRLGYRPDDIDAHIAGKRTAPLDEAAA